MIVARPAESLRQAAARSRRLLGTTWRLLLRSTQEFILNRGYRDAAQVAFFVLLTIPPFVLLFIEAFSLFFDSAEVRESVVDAILRAVPLTETEGRADVERLVDEMASGSGGFTLISAAILLYSASGVMAALRHVVNEAWRTEVRRPFLKGKVLDILLVFSLALVMALSFALTFGRNVVSSLQSEGNELAALASFLLAVVVYVVPVLIVFGALVFLYRILPAGRVDVREVWPGALVSLAGLALLQFGLRIYFANFSNYEAFYGAVGGLMAFFLAVYLSANVVVVGAQVTVGWARMRRGGAAHAA